MPVRSLLVLVRVYLGCYTPFYLLGAGTVSSDILGLSCVTLR
jgi:hypothetical protein